MKVAPGFALHRDGPRLVVVADGLEAAVAALGLFEEGGLERCLADRTDGGGRGWTAVAPLPGRPERLHLRPVRHGGWLAPLTRDRLRSPARPLAELSANAQLRAAGAPVPRPALVAARRRRDRSWTATLGTLFEEDHRNALDFLASQPARPRLLALAESAGVALRRFHDAGGRHADLHVANLIVREDPGAPRVCIVDLDRARVASPVPPRRRMREIMRLHRSLAKRGLEAADDPALHARFFAGYSGRDRELRRALWATLARERLRGALHRLAYRRTYRRT